MKKGFIPNPYEACLKLFADCSRIYRNLLFVSALSLETNDAVCHSKQGIISALSHIQTRMDLRSALSVENVASQYKLSVCSLGTQSLGLGISSVLRRTNTLFVSE